MALGMLLIIVAGHIDLSVGWLSGFLGAVSALVMVDYGMPWYVGVLVTFGVGAIVGAVQGYSVAYLKIPAFIVTLAGMLVFRGLTLNTLGGRNIGPFPDEISWLLTGFIPEMIGRIPDPIAPFNDQARAIGSSLIAGGQMAYNNVLPAISFGWFNPVAVWGPSSPVTDPMVNLTSLVISVIVVALMLFSAVARPRQAGGARHERRAAGDLPGEEHRHRRHAVLPLLPVLDL